MKLYRQIADQLKRVADGYPLVLNYTDADSDYEDYSDVFEKLKEEGYTVTINYSYPSGYLGYRAATKYIAEISKKMT